MQPISVDKLRELRREQGRNRYDHLNAWNFPMMPQQVRTASLAIPVCTALNGDLTEVFFVLVARAQVHDKAKAELEEVLKAIPSGAKTMSLANIEAILQNSLYLDQFQDRCVPFLLPHDTRDTRYGLFLRFRRIEQVV